MIRRTLTALLAPMLAAGLAAQDPGKPAKDTPPQKPPVEVDKKQDPGKKDPAGEQQKPGKEKPGPQKPEKGETEKVRGERIDRPEGQDPKKDPTPAPASADPADLRAMRSAQQMLAAEKRLAELIKKGQLEGIDKIVSFEEISNWPYEDGLKGLPKKVSSLDGKKVVMTGFMLPIEEVENIREFLLVQSLWACCFGQPPDINGIVRVVMTGKKRVDYQFDPIKIVGTFKVKAAYEDGYCVDIYQLEAESVEVIR